MPPKRSGRLSPSTLAASVAAVLLLYGAGFIRTRAAAQRLTQDTSRRRPVNMDEVQQVLDVARFTTVPEPTIGAPPTPVISAAPAFAAPASVPPVPAPATAPVADQTNRPPVVDEATHVFVPGAPAGAASASAHGAELAAGTAVEGVHAGPAPVAASTSPTPLAAADAGQAAPPAAEKPKYNDGRYLGWGYCRHGQIQAAVVIEHGRITSAEITQCGTRYSCDWIEKLPPQVVSRQSPEVDFVSGASESADAFYYAIVEALAQAKGK